ncbi:ParB/RepB/Spo0J family partition protein [Clavibacter michiganensis]|uniref:ParB/RepB/Spo0J family partition protein n=1 Tax=Clavibacter michiganensis TaxID=28447 RepID=UPI001365513C|nr:ParB/RepB/Spo0J family partition protein [Clavibacter michiganensis]MDO4026659.1 ParB/RepB/Spo0J family partition protein [Clavibacter michiganensis]MDO4036195.1 ParB/RepB/Spo0J family partition protein [Clavibacter michiganensis]MDO4048438.1 ParB/RepB/Spo0J family partition protein [Clavibacter michiganensis]MDO4076207.1 ParB/RepB/Spo0J family partition protein [Clavibacter michiganensis]MDO4106856.1 ParB/RepB/Spo0J family partition protein [Clavibacter michiganensis]
MATKRTGLGRGIGALIPTSDERSRPVDVFFPDSIGAGAPSGVQGEAHGKGEPELVAVPGARLANLDPADITPNAQQPRTDFRQDELQELMVSIREYGVLQPIVVRPLGADADGRARYELVMGERRLRATKELGLDTIPAVIKDTADESMLRDALLENLHRSELNPLEEASAYQQLLADFAITQDELAQRLGRSRPQITNTIRLLRLPEDVQHRVAAGVLSAGHARAILSSGDDEAMRHLAEKIVNEDLSVRAAEAAAQRGQRTSKPRKSASSARNAHLDDTAQRIGDHLNTSVRVTMSAQKGQIVIDFATVGDLTRIAQEMGVPDADAS